MTNQANAIEIRTERLAALKRVRSTALDFAAARKNLESAVYEAWRMGLPNMSIALEAGWNDANVRMLAIRRNWRKTG